MLPHLHPSCPNPATTLLRRQRSPGEGLMLTQTMQMSQSICKMMRDFKNAGGNSDLPSTLRMSTLVTSRSKGWSTGKPWPSGCQMHNGRDTACGLLYPAWGCYGAGITSPKDFKGTQDYQVV